MLKLTTGSDCVGMIVTPPLLSRPTQEVVNDRLIAVSRRGFLEGGDNLGSRHLAHGVPLERSLQSEEHRRKDFPSVAVSANLLHGFERFILQNLGIKPLESLQAEI